MLPVLLHRVANATQLLTGLDALLGIDPGALEARAGDLACAGERVDEAGWLLALLASAAGAHLLLDRRERAGLGPLVACVRECLRREQHDLAEPQGRLPDLWPGVAAGWQLPWAVGSILYVAGRSLPLRETLVWRVEVRSDGASLECYAATSPDLERFGAWVSCELPLARVRSAPGATTLHLPRGWLLDPEASP
jgi:hypothetical protein